MQDAGALPKPPSAERLEKLAFEIEAHVFSISKGVNSGYRTKLRGLNENLKHPDNQSLWERVVKGSELRCASFSRLC